ncbi:MAG: hypothetical protein LBI69_00650 [Puniceicoccales bacterium]|nr:hypothetical protein [Puniceicoccales bacterium]
MASENLIISPSNAQLHISKKTTRNMLCISSAVLLIGTCVLVATYLPCTFGTIAMALQLPATPLYAILLAASFGIIFSSLLGSLIFFLWNRRCRFSRKVRTQWNEYPPVECIDSTG